NQCVCRPLSKPWKTTTSQRIWLIRSASSDSGSPPSAGRSGRSSLTMRARAGRSRSLAVTGAVIRPPPPHDTPVAAVGVSAERRMAATATACTRWYPTSHNLSNFCSTLEGVITVQKKDDIEKAGGKAARQGDRGLGGMKRAVRWALLSVGLASVVTAVTVASAAATPPSGLTNIPLARGTDTSHGTLPLRFGTDIAMAQITVNPGGSSGWHSHPGGAIIIVQQGALTVYHSVDSQCRTTTYSAGQAFIER